MFEEKTYKLRKFVSFTVFVLNFTKIKNKLTDLWFKNTAYQKIEALQCNFHI